MYPSVCGCSIITCPSTNSAGTAMYSTVPACHQSCLPTPQTLSTTRQIPPLPPHTYPSFWFAATTSPCHGNTIQKTATNYTTRHIRQHTRLKHTTNWFNHLQPIHQQVKTLTPLGRNTTLVSNRITMVVTKRKTTRLKTDTAQQETNSDTNTKARENATRYQFPIT